MSTTTLEPATRIWTASELRLLSADERDKILVEAAARAEDEYLDVEMTAFGTFEGDDLHGSSSSTESR